MHTTYRTYILLIPLLLLSCASTKFYVNVNSFSSNINFKQYRYSIESGNKGVSSSDLEFLSYKRIVDSSLNKNGYFTTTEDSCNASILLSYSISAPQRILVAENQKTNVNIWTGKEEVSMNPEYATIYDKFLQLDVYSRNKNSNPIELWKTTMTCGGRDSDVGVVIPYLLKIAEKFYGKNSNGKRLLSYDFETNEIWDESSSN